MSFSRLDAIRAMGAARGESAGEAMRHHLLEGVLRRVSLRPDCGGFVLRGGLLARAWLVQAKRPTRDIDFVSDFPFDVADATARLAAAMARQVDDGITIIDIDVRGIWLETDFPGVRAAVHMALGARRELITVDVGFGDPVVPADVWIDYPALQADPVVHIRAVRPETAVAWKLHCLAERVSDFRPKDLADLCLLTAMPLETTALTSAIDAAFRSRMFTMEQARTVLSLPHWSSKSARVRWASLGHRSPDLADALATVEARLTAALAALP